MKTRNQLKKHIFIFGAGASVECGYPLGNDLFSTACWIRDESPVEKSKSEDAQWMGKILEVVEPGMRKLYRNLPENTEDWPPLEEVLSLAYNLTGNQAVDPNFVKSLESMVFYEISGCKGVTFINPSSPESANLDLVEGFIKAESTNTDNIFVSMNYDTVIDGALLDSQSDNAIPTAFDYCIPDLRDSDTGEVISPPKPAIKLLKPHGSANLFLCSECKAIFWRMDLVAAMELNNRLECPLCRKIDHTRLLVIPPYYGKGELWTAKSDVSGRWDETLLQVLSKIRLEIEDAFSRASQITIIGYSFPPYDYDFRVLFMKGLLSNESLSRSALDVSLVGFSPTGDKQEIEDQYAFLKPIVGKFSNIHAKGFCDWVKSLSPNR